MVRIAARRQIFVLLFLPLWLTGWSAGGIAAIMQFWQTHEPFLALWLCGWAIGEIVATGTLVWMLTGREELWVENGDLVVEHRMAGFCRRWVYQGRAMGALHVAPLASLISGYAFSGYAKLSLPMVRRGRMGSIRFDYGPRS